MRNFNLLFLSTLIFVSQSAVAGVAIGIDAISDSATRTLSSGSNEADFSADATGIRVRLSIEHVEFYISSYSVDSDADLDTTDDNELEFGANIVIFGSGSTVVPFGKLGAGFGTVPLDSTFYSEDSITNVHLNGVVGLKLMLTDRFALVGSLEAIYRIWQSVEVLSTTFDVDDRVFRAALGLELSF
ncbi:MAG: hypothetical protein P1U80_06085 [Pseudomonadales bacterium]|jgi:hypothetical protein|nr:hypothetical protein [Pseudomonadales bacterium]